MVLLVTVLGVMLGRAVYIATEANSSNIPYPSNYTGPRTSVYDSDILSHRRALGVLGLWVHANRCFRYSVSLPRA